MKKILFAMAMMLAGCDEEVTMVPDAAPMMTADANLPPDANVVPDAQVMPDAQPDAFIVPCGGQGQACCNATLPDNSDGTCNDAAHRCSQTDATGGLYGCFRPFCIPGAGNCGSGRACMFNVDWNNYFCVSAGDPGQPCYEDHTCNEGAACVGICVKQ